MVLSASLSDRLRAACRSVRHVPRLFVSVQAFVLFLIFSPKSYGFSERSAAPNGGFWGGIVVGFVLLLVVAVLARIRIKAAEQEALRSKELADHRSEEHTSE